MDAPKLDPKESLKASFPKLNQAIDNANEALNKNIEVDIKVDETINKVNDVKEIAEQNKAEFKRTIKTYENYIDDSMLITGKYYNSYTNQYGTWVTQANSNDYKTLPYIDLESGINYSITRIVPALSYFLAEDGRVVSKLDTQITAVSGGQGEGSFSLPSGATKVALTFHTNRDQVMLVNENKIPSNYQPKGVYKRIVDKLVIPQNNDNPNDDNYTETILEVDHNYTSATSGFGVTKFKSIIDAHNAINDASITKPYKILVYPGTYNEWENVFGGHVTDGEYKGISLKSYVVIESTNVNRPEDYILSFDGHAGIPDGEDMTYDDAFKKCLFHIIGKKYECGVRGFTLQSKNTRYCFHPEDSGDSYGSSWFLENCILDWQGNEFSNQTGYWGFALGIGIGPGATAKIKNCKWKNKDMQSGSGVVAHNNQWNPYVTKPFIIPGADITFENCDFGDNNIRFDTYKNDSDVFDILRFINCKNINKASHSFQGGATIQNWRVIKEATQIIDDQFEY